MHLELAFLSFRHEICQSLILSIQKSSLQIYPVAFNRCALHRSIFACTQERACPQIWNGQKVAEKKHYISFPFFRSLFGLSQWLQQVPHHTCSSHGLILHEHVWNLRITQISVKRYGASLTLQYRFGTCQLLNFSVHLAISFATCKLCPAIRVAIEHILSNILTLCASSRVIWHQTWQNHGKNSTR